MIFGEKHGILRVPEVINFQRYKKCAELQTTKAIQWADDCEIAFRLNNQGTTAYNALKSSVVLGIFN